MEDRVKEFSQEAVGNEEKEEKFKNALKYERQKLKKQYFF